MNSIWKLIPALLAEAEASLAPSLPEKCRLFIAVTSEPFGRGEYTATVAHWPTGVTAEGYGDTPHAAAMAAIGALHDDEHTRQIETHRTFVQNVITRLKSAVEEGGAQ